MSQKRSGRIRALRDGSFEGQALFSCRSVGTRKQVCRDLCRVDVEKETLNFNTKHWQLDCSGSCAEMKVSFFPMLAGAGQADVGWARAGQGWET